MKERINILVVDDDKQTRSIFKKSLEHTGYFIQESEDGLEALEMLKRDQFHIVITDLRMPRMDGNQLLSEIKKMDQTIEVILVSARRDIDVAVKLMKKGAYDYITKPFDLQKFLNTVKQCAEKRLLASENLELKERLALLEVSKALNSTLDLKSLLKLIMHSIQKVILADQGSIMLLDKKNNRLAIEASFGLSDDLIKKNEFDFRKSPSWKVIKHGEPVLINELERYPQFKEFKSRKKINSSIIVPLKIKDKTIGVINLARTKIVSKFTQRDLYLLTIFAGQAASTIENANLYKKLKDYSLIIEQEKDEVQAIVENISEGIIVCETPSKIVLMNPSARKIFRIGNASMIDQSCPGVFHREDFIQVADFIREFNDSNSNFMERKLNLNIDGENIHLRATIARMKTYDNKKELKILAVEDLTRLVQTQKVAAWQDVARNLAHEVKNPLSPILWSAEAILEQNLAHSKDSKALVEKKCSTIIREVKRIQSLISDFSSFAKLPEPDLKPASVESVLQEILPLYSSHPDIIITTDFQRDLPYIKMDVKMMKQVFINLIQNAIEAMPDGGKLTITCGVRAGEVMISLEDTGKGIPENIMEHLFDPYFTTKKSGTGLGLTISSKIVSNHQGQIRVKSKENQGAAFAVYLPFS